MEKRKYAFHWGLLGDIELGRPNLGPILRLEIYRLMMFTLRDVLERRYGSDQADVIFNEAGYLAGRNYYLKLFPEKPAWQDFLAKLQDSLLHLGVGILRLEQNAPDGQLVLTVEEDLDCSGLPEIEDEICTYDEGFLAGILECYTGRPYKVKEIDCWCTGERICRFRADPSQTATGGGAES